jgi:hypothetical protein
MLQPPQPARQLGYRELHEGEPVEFERADDFGQDGCQWRVKWVQPTGWE